MTEPTCPSFRRAGCPGTGRGTGRLPFGLCHRLQALSRGLRRVSVGRSAPVAVACLPVCLRIIQRKASGTVYNMQKLCLNEQTMQYTTKNKVCNDACKEDWQGKWRKEERRKNGGLVKLCGLILFSCLFKSFPKVWTIAGSKSLIPGYPSLPQAPDWS